MYHHFDDPQINDDDSILACMVGAARWRGYSIDIEKIEALRAKTILFLNSFKYNFNSVDVCKKYLFQVLDDTEQMAMRHGGKVTTKATILEEIVRWRESEVCDDCEGFGCEKCNDGLVETEKPHPAAQRARHILDYRHAVKEVEIYDKLLKAGRFHASFIIIGAKSSRMSGADGLNPQGIKHANYVRECFGLADEGEILCGGDMVSSQIAISDAVYKDPKIHEELLAGKKIYPIFGEYLFPGKSYDDILATQGLPNEQDLYDRSKKGVLAMLFGGEEYTLQTRVGISEQGATDAYRLWCKDHPVWATERRKYFNMFCSMRQPGGIGTKVIWTEPSDYVESMFGFRRYFTLENTICRVLFHLAQKVPYSWKELKVKVVRRDRQQTAHGAVCSALYAAAFQLQAANMRAAANHVIQSPEASILKNFQCEIWTLQPSGIERWIVRPMNIHDEIQSPTDSDYAEKTIPIVEACVKHYQQYIPLLAMDWKVGLENWAAK